MYTGLRVSALVCVRDNISLPSFLSLSPSSFPLRLSFYHAILLTLTGLQLYQHRPAIAHGVSALLIPKVPINQPPIL